jgi:hypothetical protein
MKKIYQNKMGVDFLHLEDRLPNVHRIASLFDNIPQPNTTLLVAYFFLRFVSGLFLGAT